LKVKSLFFYIILQLFFFNCDFFSSQPKKAIARIDEKFIFFEDIKEDIPSNLTKEDSTTYVKNILTKLATKHILNTKALLNLSKDEQKKLLDLVASYKNDLFSYSYQEKMVRSLMDTIISEDEIEMYYRNNNSNFKLNQDLVKARYIKINSDNYNISDIRSRFKRFNNKDMIFLDSISLQFTSFSFNDSTWVNKDLFFSRIPDLKNYVKNNIVKKSLFYQIQDSSNLYLIKINKSIFRNDLAPLDYIKPTLKQILLNKKKLEFVSNFEKDLIINALQNKELEFYEDN